MTHAHRHHQPRHRRRDYSGALREALLKCEAELLDAEQAAGSTALLALMVDGHLFLANVGDCRAVVCDEAENRLHVQKGILAWCFEAVA